MVAPFLNGMDKGKETVPLVFCEEKRNIIQRCNPVKQIIMMFSDPILVGSILVFLILSTKQINFSKFKVNL
jgi:hypothetical protein